MQRFRSGLVFKAHRILFHFTLGLSVIKKEEKVEWLGVDLRGEGQHHVSRVRALNSDGLFSEVSV